jgi:quinol monooxygenase YgiN
MMTVLAVRHTVADYATWKTGYDNHGASRKEHGAIRDQVLQSVEDPNNLLVLIEFGSTADAKAFANDPTLKAAMSTAGVIGAPDISLRERTDEATH